MKNNKPSRNWLCSLKFTKYICSWVKCYFLKEKEFPAGIKLIIQILIVGLTIYAAHIVVANQNMQFAKNERKSQYYSSLVSKLNEDTKTVLGKLSIYQFKFLSEEKRQDTYLDLKASLTRLHWRSVEFFVVFESAKLKNNINAYQKSLKGLEAELTKSLVNPKGFEGDYVSNEAVEDFALQSVLLLNTIADEADIKVKHEIGER